MEDTLWRRKLWGRELLFAGFFVLVTLFLPLLVSFKLIQNKKVYRKKGGRKSPKSPTPAVLGKSTSQKELHLFRFSQTARTTVRGGSGGEGTYAVEEASEVSLPKLTLQRIPLKAKPPWRGGSNGEDPEGTLIASRWRPGAEQACARHRTRVSG